MQLSTTDQAWTVTYSSKICNKIHPIVQIHLVLKCAQYLFLHRYFYSTSENNSGVGGCNDTWLLCD